MPSQSLVRWSGGRKAELDEIENAHAIVGGTSRGRRYATQQINHAYATLLSAQFQGFCRDLHSECIDCILARTPAPLQTLLKEQFVWARKLDSGNPNAGNIGSDFNRFGLSFWPLVQAERRHNLRRQRSLEELNLWRNAIAHQAFPPGLPGGWPLELAAIRRWRRSVNVLAVSFDRVMRSYLHGLTGAVPW